ncbi:MAG: BcpO-related WXXGXW repeat protein [Pirellulaceae bacterium]|nr:BcpO-related WXXGXW repeat protein [Pirellulaceae bacterium]
MSQDRLFAITIHRTLVVAAIGIAVIGVAVIGVADSALAQNEILSGQPTPPPPTAADTSAAAAASDAIDRDATNELGYRELLQGPVHEAFAPHTETGAQVDPRVYGEKPPADVREQPPEDRPEGNNLLWIPGYWSWIDVGAEVGGDGGNGKYVWVSGVYRKVPPGRTWVPGYWSADGAGYRWTSGYWSSTHAGVDDQVYLPAPPQSIDNGPSVPPPSDDYFWLPGSWQYGDGVYRWRSGYWTRHYEGWVWQPACYIPTPSGYIYNSGYWDVLPPNRGLLYSPVEFYRPVYLNPRFVYRPRYPLANSAAFLLNLFVRRGHPGFFYGNYYGPSYAALGYQPWYDLGFGLGGFGSRYSSPWLTYYDWNYGRRGIDFRNSMGRYQSFYDKAGRGGPHPVKFDADIAKLSEQRNSGRGSREKAVGGSLDDVVLRDFNGQSPPRVDRQPNAKFSKHNGNLSPAKTKGNFDPQRASNRSFATPNPQQSSPRQPSFRQPSFQQSSPQPLNPKKSNAGAMLEHQGKKSQGFSSSPQTFDRGRPQSSIQRPPSIQRSQSPRGPDSFGGSNKGSGKSFGGGNSGRGGGGGGKGKSGKGGGKK